MQCSIDLKVPLWRGTSQCVLLLGLCVCFSFSSLVHPQCKQLQQSPNFYTNPCTKVWMEVINKTIVYALKVNENFEHDIWNLNRKFHTITAYCSYQKNVRWQGNLVRINHARTLCGVGIINLRKNAGRRETDLHVNVPTRFALNITFLYFLVDEYGDDSCAHASVRTMFMYGTSQVCFLSPIDGVCGRRHPWSMFIPSHHAMIYLIAIKLSNLVKFHVLYQVIEKCVSLNSLRYAHILKTVQLKQGTVNIIMYHYELCDL